MFVTYSGSSWLKLVQVLSSKLRLIFHIINKHAIQNDNKRTHYFALSISNIQAIKCNNNKTSHHLALSILIKLDCK